MLVGIFSFGETVENFNEFFYSSYMGRFTLMDWLNLPTGVVVLLVVLMALFMFWGAEKLEAIFGGGDPRKAPKIRYIGAGALVVVALVVMIIGQPTAADKWNALSSEKGPELVEQRAYQIHPGELLGLVHNNDIKLFMFDIRSEADYNLFHIKDAINISAEQLEQQVGTYRLEPSNAVFVVMGNNEELATEAWKMLEGESLHNVYILEGGINYWLDVFDTDAGHNAKLTIHPGEALDHEFSAALGSQFPAANPDPELVEEIDFVPKVKLELKQGPTGGGCG